MTGINDITDLKPTTEKDLFAFKINYNTVENCVNYTGTALYNGNISETYWRTAADNVARKYGYKYDNLNRLKAAIYQKANTVTPSLTTVTNKFDENLTYDKNGNIISLIRNGNSDTNVAPIIPIDVLAYTYAPSTNRLVSVTDTPASATSGFKDGNIGSDDYSYDANGNMITDKNKKITSITYNHLNLPTKITFATTGNIAYIYNAIGQKEEKIVTQGTTVTSTNYLGGYQYSKPPSGVWGLQFFPTAEGYVKNGGLQFFPTAEGYVKNVGGVYSYVFNYMDHLGNVRLSYAAIANVLTIIEENNYYPFGLKHNGYNNTINGSNPTKKYYQGQERQDELGLNWDSFKWRNYDYAIGRFMSIDPLCEKYTYNSTYAFQENKMGMGRELEGLELVEFKKNDGLQNFVVVVKGYSGAQNAGQTQAESYDKTSLGILTTLNSDTTKVTVFDSSPGSNTKDDVAGSILNFKSVHPDGTVVAAGHSMGADNLVEMVKENPKVKVNDLITVDIATPTYSDSDIPPTVPNAVNYYQTDSFTGREQITAQDPKKTNIQNILIPNSSHTTIDNQVAKKVLNMVNNIVNPNPQPLHNKSNPR